ncbi:MAG: hypothetical protein ISS78_01435 [Phycisphaerae bacterium]|nr:hypothetical protein [Phycisphaerae bacterium]
MKRQRLTVIAALMMVTLATGPVFAQAPVLDFPLERQVFQRNAKGWAAVKVAGTVPTNATLVEAKADLGAGLRGKAVNWTVVAQGGQIKDGRFSGSLKLETGGWYTLNVRFRKSPDDATAMAEATVKKVGVGDVFITAGQSNSVNYGKPRQKSAETLSVYFNGKQFAPAADPIPDAVGSGGTPWPILGDMLSRSTRAPVCFRSATVNWLRVRDWIPGARSGNIERLVKRAKWFGPTGIRAVLWVQGEADAGRPDFTPADQYTRDAKAMIKFSRQKLGWQVDWFVAGTSYCPPHPGKDWKEGMASVLSAQETLWNKGIAHRGPDTNDLVGSRDYRHDGIHFGPKGLLVHAERWYTILSAHYGWANPVTHAPKSLPSK